jgi:hypothetical protein
MTKPPPPPPRRPPARAKLHVVRMPVTAGQRDDLGILYAKARVCDAYRRWLESPTHTVRAEVCVALAELARREEGYHA